VTIFYAPTYSSCGGLALEQFKGSFFFVATDVLHSDTQEVADGCGF
jgi:hypothetical protein